MLTKNQIKRLMTHCTRTDKRLFKEMFNRDDWLRNLGWIEALSFVLYGDETTMNNLPINNKEKPNATRSNVDKSTSTRSVR